MYGEHNASVSPSPNDSRRHRGGTERLRHSSAMPAEYRHGNEWGRDETGMAMRPVLHCPKLFQGRECLRPMPVLEWGKSGASTRCRAHERDSLERLCRHIPRPVLSNESLSVNDREQVVYCCGPGCCPRAGSPRLHRPEQPGDGAARRGGRARELQLLLRRRASGDREPAGARRSDELKSSSLRSKPCKGFKPGLIRRSETASVVTKLEAGVESSQYFVALVGQVLAEVVRTPVRHVRPAP